MTLVTEELTRTMRVPYALRRVPIACFAHLLRCPARPQPGDIALARLEKIGRNKRLELAGGRVSNLREGDILAVVFGNRYATGQYEGYARADGEMCDLLSMAGVCGLVTSKHEGIAEPSKLRLLGGLADAKQHPLRMRDFALTPTSSTRRPRVAVVCGTAMDSGKTHTAMSLVVGLRRQEIKVGYIKLTGTASGRDTWSVVDAGASPCLEFTDGGFPSTYLVTLPELLDLYALLVGHAAAQGADWIIVEIADGLLQAETASLLREPRFVATVDSWILAASEPLAATGGVRLLREIGIEPIALSGRFSMSPLGMRETRTATGIRCVTAREIQRGELTQCLLQAKVSSDGAPETPAFDGLKAVEAP